MIYLKRPPNDAARAKAWRQRNRQHVNAYKRAYRARRKAMARDEVERR